MTIHYAEWLVNDADLTSNFEQYGLTVDEPQPDFVEYLVAFDIEFEPARCEWRHPHPESSRAVPHGLIGPRPCWTLARMSCRCSR